MRNSLIVGVLISVSYLSAQDLKPISLPPPQTDGGRPLMQVLKERKSSRDFAAQQLPLQLLSNLLWAAFGVNSLDGRRTAPSAMNWQEVDIYVATADGLFLCEAKGNRLEAVLAQDIRSSTGMQSFAATAPLNLVYVSAFPGTLVRTPNCSQRRAGFISQNVYLFCASENLATVVRGFDRSGCSRQNDEAAS